ncbi:HAD family hydrolase, partial [Faecalicatena contorta]|nr:HAD family hydrolase [Faecalicatena contorta]
MRVFDFDGTIYKGESLFDLYLFSVRYEPRVLKYIAPVAQCGIRYKTGRAELSTMERKLGRVIRRYLQDIDSSKRVSR